MIAELLNYRCKTLPCRGGLYGLIGQGRRSHKAMVARKLKRDRDVWLWSVLRFDYATKQSPVLPSTAHDAWRMMHDEICAVLSHDRQL
jgi:hypothetical protein